MIVWKNPLHFWGNARPCNGELLVPIPEQVIIDMVCEGIEVEWTLDGTSALLTEHEQTTTKLYHIYVNKTCVKHCLSEN